MKNTLLILAAALLCYCANAQTNVINSTGNVGIGTTSPGQVLDVTGTGGAFNSTANANSIFVQDHTNYKGVYLGFDNSGQIGVIAGSTSGAPSNLAFWNYNGGWYEAMRLTSGGNLGIGTTSPNGKLQIVGPLDGSVPNLEIGDPSSGNTAVPVGSATGGYNIDFHTWRDVLPNQIGARIRAERINNYIPNSALVQSMDLAFYTSDGWNVPDLTERLRIKSTGNIGIGTKNPDQLLTVNGTIHAKQVNVDVNIVPDYVFNKGYKLRSLNEVSRYIALNKHLPEIPSGKSMEKNGVNVNEFNMKMLQKVEELTLYLIDKDKEISEQRRQIADQQNINQQQQKQLADQQKFNQSLQQQINQLAKSLKH